MHINCLPLFPTIIEALWICQRAPEQAIQGSSCSPHQFHRTQARSASDSPPARVGHISACCGCAVNCGKSKIDGSVEGIFRSVLCVGVLYYLPR